MIESSIAAFAFIGILSLWDDLKLTPCFVLSLLFESFCHDVMVVLDLRGCMECVEDHLLFIRVIFLSYSGHLVLVLVHACSTSFGKEVSGSLC